MRSTKKEDVLPLRFSGKYFGDEETLMRIRLISGTCYIAVLVLAFCLKIFIPNPYGDFCFDILTYAFALIGTFEMLRALKEKTTFSERVLVVAFSAITIPVCAICEVYFKGYGGGMLAVSGCLAALVLALLLLLIINHKETTLESLGMSLLAAVYPTLLLVLLVIINHTAGDAELAKFALNSDIMILFVFVITPFADSLAYVFGRFLRKYFSKKLAPELSPNKTVIGFIGGLVGGAVGATALYFIYNAIVGSFAQMYIWLPVYIGIAMLTAVATALGDLVESCIKRKLNIKDMGKLMPGHGGILDRIDGVLFAAVAVYLCFSVIFMIV